MPLGTNWSTFDANVEKDNNKAINITNETEKDMETDGGSQL